MGRNRIGLVLGVSLVVGLASGVEAREVLRENFEAGGVAGRDGGGWTQLDSNRFLDREVAVGKAPRGAISFDLQRRREADPGTRGRVFSLREASDPSSLEFSVVWVSEVDGQSALTLVTPPRGKFRRTVPAFFGYIVPLGREVKPGEWVHLDLAWDDEAGVCDIYADGIKLKARPQVRSEGGFVLVAAGDPASSLADRLMTSGPSLPLAWSLGEMLSRALAFRWGQAPAAQSQSEAAGAIGRARHPEMPLSNAIVDNFVVVVDERMELVSNVHGRGYDPRDLRGQFIPGGGVRLSWQSPEVRAINQSYVIYRRSGSAGNARFEKLTPTRVGDLTYLDATARQGETYRYSVAAVYVDERGRDLESKYPPEVTVTAAGVAVATVAADKTVYGGGQEVVVTLRGTADGAAHFSLAGVTSAPVTMAEVDDGVYVGKVAAPAGLNLAAAKLSGTLTLGGVTASAVGAAVAVDSTPPAAVGNILASASWVGEVEVAWDPSPSADLDHYAVYRAVAVDPPTSGEPLTTAREPKLLDASVIPGLSYRYLVVPVDKAGNAGPASAVAEAKAVGADTLVAVAAEPAAQTLRPGAVLTVTAVGRSGGQATADLGALVQGIALAEQGRTGRYTGSYTVRQEDVAAAKTLHRVVARLIDAAGEAAVLAGPEVAVVGQDGLNDRTPPTIVAVGHDGFKVAGLSGKLVAGDVVTVTAQSEPGGSGSFSVPGVVKNVPLKETAQGVYTGSFSAPWGAVGSELPVVVTLVDENGNEATARTERGLTFDTRLRLAVAADKALLPADRKSRARLSARAQNANGKAVEGHELVLTLSTTEEYTGVVGGGSVEGKRATLDDFDDIEVKWGGKTDGFGEVTADYTAGFAAKTALVVAKDLTTGDVGAGWLNTYVASTVAIELAPRAAKGAEDRAVLRMSADPSKLTADGRSTSRIKLWLTDPSGTALAGAKVAFSLGNENGRLRVLRATTDAKGVAEAEYRAGTAIGTVTVTATAAEYGVTGSVQIVLMADAPAKIDLVASATRLVADGSSKATLSIAVTDIHDNPNAQVPVTFAILQGAGGVAEPAILTDRNGEGQVTFTAGTKPGTVIVEARHTSRAPSEQELRRVYGTVFVPRWYDRQERDRLKVVEWLVKPGDAVERGATLVVVEGRMGTQTLEAPAKGVFVREVKHEHDAVELGDTVGYVEIDPGAWREVYGR